MTLEQFYNELSKLPSKGYSVEIVDINQHSEIRLFNKNYVEFCPITAVCYEITNKFFVAENFEPAAKLLKFRGKTANNIVEAADGKFLGNNAISYIKIRGKIMNVLGV